MKQRQGIPAIARFTTPEQEARIGQRARWSYYRIRGVRQPYAYSRLTSQWFRLKDYADHTRQPKYGMTEVSPRLKAHNYDPRVESLHAFAKGPVYGTYTRTLPYLGATKDLSWEELAEFTAKAKMARSLKEHLSPAGVQWFVDRCAVFGLPQLRVTPTLLDPYTYPDDWDESYVV